MLCIADSCHACFQKRCLLLSINNDHSEICLWKMMPLVVLFKYCYMIKPFSQVLVHMAIM